MARSLTCALWLGAVIPAVGQPPPVASPPPPPPPVLASPPPPPPPDSGLTVRDASVGYIDPAVPADQLRLRADFGYDFRTPTRAEFFYPRARPLGPGLPEPERSVDFQDYTLYLEKIVGPGFSVFAEGGLRALNPDLNDNFAGLADANIGFKYAYVVEPSQVWSLQLRAYLPTGAERPALRVKELGPGGRAEVVPEVGPEAELVGGDSRVDIPDARIADGEPAVGRRWWRSCQNRRRRRRWRRHRRRLAHGRDNGCQPQSASE